MKLQHERQARGWSKSELARRAGLNHTTIGQIESRRFKPYPGQLRKLAFALGLPEGDAHQLLDEGCAATGRPETDRPTIVGPCTAGGVASS